MVKFLSLLLFSVFLLTSHHLFSHEEHFQKIVNADILVKWLGQFHPISLHFPIALIVMTCVSEFLSLWFGNKLFKNASHFMIISAAITVIPTVLFGFAYAYETNYEGVLANIFWWHRSSGVFTGIFAIVTAILKELDIRKFWGMKTAYYLCLTILFLSVNITGYLGGEMTFGLWHLLP